MSKIVTTAAQKLLTSKVVSVIFVGGPHVEFATRSAMFRDVRRQFEKGTLTRGQIAVGFETTIEDETPGMVRRNMENFENGRFDKFCAELDQLRVAPGASAGAARAEFTEETVTRSWIKFCKENGIAYRQLDPEGINEIFEDAELKRKVFAGDLKLLLSLENRRIDGMLQNTRALANEAPIVLSFVGLNHLARLTGECPKYLSKERGFSALQTTALIPWSELDRRLSGIEVDELWEDAKSSFGGETWPRVKLQFPEANCDPKNPSLFTNNVFAKVIKDAVEFTKQKEALTR